MEKNKPKTALVKRETPKMLSPLSEMERMMADFMRRPFAMFPTIWPRMDIIEEEMIPAIDIYEEGDSVIAKVELPGMKKEDINVEVNNGILKISGEKKREEKVEKKNYYRIERSSGSFERSITLPFETQADKAKASFKDGVLQIKIPKSEEAKKKETKITIE